MGDRWFGIRRIDYGGLVSILVAVGSNAWRTGHFGEDTPQNWRSDQCNRGVVFLGDPRRQGVRLRHETFFRPKCFRSANDVHGLQHTRSDTHHHHGRGGRRNLGRRGPTGARDETRSRNPRGGPGLRNVVTHGGQYRKKTITLTFIVGGALAGAAGFMYSLQSGIEWNSGVELGIYAFTAAVLGGIGNLRGAALGGMVIGLFGSFAVPFAF